MAEGDGIPRGGFLAAALAALATLEPKAAAAQTANPSSRIQSLPQALRRSLVLSGGGALGAYEAGAVAAMVAKAGVGEGQPLPQYGVVCGTSIGALNAYLIATAQWQRLANIWSSIAAQHVIRLKPEFAKLTDQSSGVGNRLAQAIGLAVGVFKDVQGVIDGEHLEQWLTEYLDLSKPIVTPIVWATTNLTREVVEYFYLVPEGYDKNRRDIALQSVQLSVGRNIAVREADRKLLVKQLRASAAVPVAFDPVVLPGPDGEPSQYVDGGVTANTPIAVARAMSSAVDTILLAPPFKGTVYKDAFGIANGSFDTVQRALMEGAVRNAYLETFLLRALRNDPNPDWLKGIAAAQGYNIDELLAFANLLSDTDFFIMQPVEPLPVTLFGFNDATAIAKTYATGEADGVKGFQPFNYLKLEV
jgi:predicted acylesterase/phospholipase RssA